jgi:hypothetical protein
MKLGLRTFCGLRTDRSSQLKAFQLETEYLPMDRNEHPGGQQRQLKAFQLETLVDSRG